MTDFRDRLEQELRVAAERRSQPARRSLLLARRTLVPAIAVGAAALAIVFVPRPADQRFEPAQRSAPPAMVGTFERANAPGLRIQPTSIRTLEGPPVGSVLLGFISVSADRLSIRVDPARVGHDPWPGPFCRRGRRDAVGAYRFRVADDALTFEAIDDPCEGRRRLLTAGQWRRAGR